MPSFEREFLPHVVRAALFAVLWMLLWSFFLLGVVRPGARLHAHTSQLHVQAAPAAAIASAGSAEGGRP